MVLKIIGATEARVGTNIIVDGISCVIKKMDISKTGKHGHAKVRIEAVPLIDGNKKIFVIPGHDKIEIPMVDKRKGQVLSIGEKVSVMDLSSFETIEIDSPAEEIKNTLEVNSNVEFWDIEGTKVIKRKI